MRNIIRFILTYHFTILFLIFETVALVTLVRSNAYQRSVAASSSNYIAGSIFLRYSTLHEYFMLKEINDDLSRENAFLRSQMPGTVNSSRDYFSTVYDSLAQRQYTYRQAKVINNSVNKQYNYITIDKGRLNGIRPEMGVISANGVVGIVSNVSNHFATIVSVLNTRLKISAKLKKTNYFGAIEWDGTSSSYVALNEIPSHAIVNVEDSVVTSGYSAIFPENIFIGTVEEASVNEGDGFYSIKIRLAEDFKSVSYVQVIENAMRTEQITLENTTEND